MKSLQEAAVFHTEMPKQILMSTLQAEALFLIHTHFRNDSKGYKPVTKQLQFCHKYWLAFFCMIYWNQEKEHILQMLYYPIQPRQTGGLNEDCIKHKFRYRDASIGVANAYTYPFYYVRYGRQFWWHPNSLLIRCGNTYNVSGGSLFWFARIRNILQCGYYISVCLDIWKRGGVFILLSP